MNQETQARLLSDLNSFPTYKKKLEAFQDTVTDEEINFINNPEAFEFLKLEMYTKKQDNEYQSTGTAGVPVEVIEKFSLLDLINKIQNEPNETKEDTFQLDLQCIKDQENPGSSNCPQQRYFVLTQ
jgi:hypothetical protein